MKTTVFSKRGLEHPGRLLFYFLLTAFSLRVIFLTVVRDYPLLYIQSLDEKYYVELGKSIAGGTLGGEPGAFFMDPLYGYFLALIFFLFGDNLTAVRLVQILLDSFNVIIILVIGRRVWNPGAGIIAAIIWSTYTVAFYYSLLLLKVTLATTGILIFILMLLSAVKNQRKKVVWFFLGMAAGVLNYISANFILIIPLTLFFYGFIERSKWQILIRNSVIFLLGAMTLLSLGGIRNYIITGQPAFLNTSSGLILYSCNNPQNTTGLFDVPEFSQSHPVACQKDFHSEAERRTGEPLSSRDASNFWRNETFRAVKHHPQIIPILILNKLKWTLANYEITMNQPYQFVANFSGVDKWPLPNYAFILAFGLPGLIVGIFQKKKVGWLLIPILTIMATMMIFYVCTRFRMPMVPFLVIGAGIWFCIAYAWAKNRNWSKIIGLFLASSLLFFLSMMISPPPGDGYKEFGLAKAFFLQNDHDRAEALALTALNQFPDNPDLYILLGRIARKKGRIGKAIEYYQKAMKINPDNFTVNYDLGILYMDTGKPEHAITYLRKSLTFKRYKKGMLNLARAYEACGNNRQAIRYYREFLESADPDDPGRDYAKDRLSIIR